MDIKRMIADYGPLTMAFLVIVCAIVIVGCLWAAGMLWLSSPLKAGLITGVLAVFLLLALAFRRIGGR